MSISKRYGILFIVLGSMLWGTDTLFRRSLTTALSPVTIVLLEHCVLVLVTLPLVLREGARIRALVRSEWGALIGIAAGGSVIATSLFTYSIKYGNPTVAVLLQKTQPILTLAMARWLLGERPKGWLWPWVAPAIAGAYLVSVPDWREGFGPQPGQLLAVLAALGASLLWGASTVFGRYVANRLPAFALTGLRFTLALPILAVVWALEPAAARNLPEGADAWGSLVAMALVPGLAALVVYYRGLRSTPASIACMGELAFPLTAVATNWLVLGIGLTASQVFGGFVLVGSVTALTYLNARHPHQAP
jgi:drug/metabolite transporter, DME family